MELSHIAEILIVCILSLVGWIGIRLFYIIDKLYKLFHDVNIRVVRIETKLTLEKGNEIP